MKKGKGTKRLARVSPRIAFLRMQLASAESIWKEAKEQSVSAKRRRKFAKLLARRAKAHAKRAKEQFVNARATLALAEAKAMTDVRPPRRGRVRKRQSKVVQAKGRVSTRKRISKAVSIVRSPKAAEPPAATVLQAVIREMDGRAAQDDSATPGTSPGQV
jgi:hypothetical protein